MDSIVSIMRACRSGWKSRPESVLLGQIVCQGQGGRKGPARIDL